ncbi:hypothetical protein [Algibacillus agarilyticus]|uniref:hypothetical protein n=1 Tax=Algibacillus agarilyticus TaxID=2234133 RepID=UPI000DCFC179|nr:hypothetical protein [Algibacillus agarilyticus]
MKTWKNIKTTRKRIKKSGKYHFKMPIENIKPGKYRVNAYLTPRGKDWQDKIGDQVGQNLTVVDADKYVKTINFNNMDKIKSAKWPKQINDNNEHILNIKYSLTEVRDLHIRLLNRKNWQAEGTLKFKVTEPGEISLPINNMLNDFPAGKYAWVMYLTAVDETERLSDKLGKNFILGDIPAE